MPYVRLDKEVLARRDLPPAAKLIYASIVDRIGRKGYSYPGVRRIAEDCGCSPGTVKTAVDQLADAGLLVVEHGTGPRGSNRYRLPVQNLSAQNPNAGAQELNAARSDFDTKPIPSNQTPLTKPQARPKSDPWQTAVTAMTGDALKTEEFKSAWLDWVQHRAEIRKPLTPMTIRGQIRQLEKLGLEQATETLERSIANGWQGLFPTTGKRGGKDRTADGGGSTRRGEYPAEETQARLL